MAGMRDLESSKCAASEASAKDARTVKYCEGWSLAFKDDKLAAITYPNGKKAEISYDDDEANRVKLPDGTVWTKPSKYDYSWYEGNRKCLDTLGCITVFNDGRIISKKWKTAQERTWYPDGINKVATPDLTGDELTGLYQSALPQIDFNKDSKLTKAELRNAITNPAVKGDVARFAAIAYRSFDDLSSLTWKCPGVEAIIGKEDIAVYNSSSVQKLDNWSKLAGMLNNTEAKIGSIYRNLHDIDGKNRHRHLYSLSGDAAKSIQSKFVKQGLLADCYFHAAVASIAEARPDLIKSMIQSNKDGTYTVTFADSSITINGLTEAEKMLYGSSTEGGLWPLLIEKAYGEQLKTEYSKLGLGSVVNTMLPYQLTDIPGQTERVLNKITGQKHHMVILPMTDENDISAKLKSACEQHIPMTCGTRIADIRPHLDGLETLHAYSVLSYDDNKRLVTIRNPHGADDSSFQGTCQMTLKQFRDNFTDLYLAWKPQ
ncbi:MAG: hypothetical protein K2Y22_12495 [Candidatus Obscuribacterales bacterium]|nr:hypothetical protein [Candidatus Obscuribacterales bacterium]